MKKFFFVLLSTALIFACSKEEEKEGEGGNSSTEATVVRLGTSTITFEAVAPESQTVKVYADGSWTSEADEWITVEPASGEGTVTVTISVKDNESTDGRVGTVVFAPELTSTTNKLSVQQKGDNKVTIRNGQALADWLAGLTAESLDEARLANDIDMSGITLVSAEAFSGDFDGAGHAIKNLKATGPLFWVNKGNIHDVVIDATCSFEPDTLIFGTIAARNEGVVKDCINKADVTRTIAPTDSKSNLVAGIIGVSTPKDEEGVEPISGCKNYGKISLVVTDNGAFTTQGVAGIVAYTLTPVVNCENYGDVSLSGGYHARRACPVRDPSDPDNIETGEFYNKKVSSALGGVVSWAFGSLSNCVNSGKVSWTESKVEGMTSSPARIFTGGVSGTYYGTVSDCSNSGEIAIKVVTSTGESFNGQNHQHCMGGVFGAYNNPIDDAPSKNRGGSISNCSNSGNINVETQTTKDWAHLGGVVGWPASENDNTNPSNWGVMSSCSNSGSITVSGMGKIRVGGIVGVTPYMENCSNTGNISLLGVQDYSEIGGIAGHHWGFAQTIKNCSSKANIESTSIIDVGGFFGWVGNKSKSSQSASVEGGSFSGSITDASGSDTGILVGGFAANKIACTIGSSTAPVEISGSVNGTAVTAANAASLLCGINFDESAQSFNYVVK